MKLGFRTTNPWVVRGAGNSIANVKSLGLSIEFADLLKVTVVAKLQVQLVGGEISHGALGLLDRLALGVGGILGSAGAILHPVDHLIDAHKVGVMVFGQNFVDKLEQTLSFAFLLNPVFAQVEWEWSPVSVIESFKVLHKQVENLVLGWCIVDRAIVVEQNAASSGGALTLNLHCEKKQIIESLITFIICAAL